MSELVYLSIFGDLLVLALCVGVLIVAWCVNRDTKKALDRKQEWILKGGTRLKFFMEDHDEHED